MTKKVGTKGLMNDLNTRMSSFLSTRVNPPILRKSQTLQTPWL